MYSVPAHSKLQYRVVRNYSITTRGEVQRKAHAQVKDLICSKLEKEKTSLDRSKLKYRPKKHRNSPHRSTPQHIRHNQPKEITFKSF